MTITFYKFGEKWGLPDPSPFCVKLESFMRLNDIPFTLGEFDMKSTLGKAPKKKMPFIVFDDAQRMGDSSLIIRHLSQQNNINMEADLSPVQQAQAHAFRRMLDESTYFCLLYARWVDDNGWKTFKPAFFGDTGMPNFLVNIISGKIRKDVTAKIYGQGIARHTKEDIYTHGMQDIEALSNLLGSDEWFFGGKKPSLLDIWAHAFISSLIRAPFHDALSENTRKIDNLVAHTDRFDALVYASNEPTEKAAA